MHHLGLTHRTHGDVCAGKTCLKSWAVAWKYSCLRSPGHLLNKRVSWPMHKLYTVTGEDTLQACGRARYRHGQDEELRAAHGEAEAGHLLSMETVGLCTGPLLLGTWGGHSLRACSHHPTLCTLQPGATYRAPNTLCTAYAWPGSWGRKGCWTRQRSGRLGLAMLTAPAQAGGSFSVKVRPGSSPSILPAPTPRTPPPPPPSCC